MWRSCLSRPPGPLDVGRRRFLDAHGDILHPEHKANWPVKVISCKNEITGFRQLEQMRPAPRVLQPTFQVRIRKDPRRSGLLGIDGETPDQVETMLAQALKNNNWSLSWWRVARASRNSRGRRRLH